MSDYQLTHQQVIYSLTTAVYDCLLTRDDPQVVKEYEEKIRRSLETYDEGFLREALVFMGDGLSYDEQADNTAGMLESGEPESVIRAYWHFVPHLVVGINSPFPPQRLFESFRYYPELSGCMEDNRYMEDRVTEQCAAIMNVVTTLTDEPIHHGKDSVDYVETAKLPVLKDKRLASLLIEHPEHAERVMDLIEKRGKVDYELAMVALGLKDGAAALTDGVL